MDPLAIAGSAIALALSAAKIGKFLHQIYDETKSVDSNLEIFTKEVQTLSETLNSVGTTLKDPKLKHAFSNAVVEEGGQRNQLSSLNTLLVDCDKSLTHVEFILEGVRKGKTSKGFFKKPTMALKLNLKSPDMIIARSQLGSYLSAMQLNLHMMTLLMSADTGSAIGRINEALESGFDSLKQEILALTFSLHNLGKDPDLAELPEFKEHIVRTTHVKEYLQSIEVVIASASEYYGSVAGTVRIDQSVRGLSAEQAERVNRWVPTADKIHEHEDDLPEEDDDFEKSMTRQYLQIAKSKMDAKKYEDAETYFNQFISRAVAASNWTDEEIVAAKIGLASSLFGQSKFNLARKILEPYGGITDEVTTQQAVMYLYLAEAFFACGWLKLAKQYAEAAMKGLRKFMGPTSDEFYNSANRLREILIMEGDFREAEVYQFMLPKNFLPTRMPGCRVATIPQDPQPKPLKQVTIPFLKSRRMIRNGIGEPTEFAIREFLRAVKQFDHPYAKTLLQSQYVDADTDSECGKLAMRAAIERSDVTMVQILIKHGACVDSPSWRSDTQWLLQSVKIGHWPMVDLLLSSGAKPSWYSNEYNASPLRYACRDGQFEVARLLIRTGANLNDANFDDADKEGISILKEMINADKEDMVKLLLECGVHNSQSSRIFAKSKNNPAIIKMLNDSWDAELEASEKMEDYFPIRLRHSPVAP